MQRLKCHLFDLSKTHPQILELTLEDDIRSLPSFFTERDVADYSTEFKN